MKKKQPKIKPYANRSLFQ